MWAGHKTLGVNLQAFHVAGSKGNFNSWTEKGWASLWETEAFSGTSQGGQHCQMAVVSVVTLQGQWFLAECTMWLKWICVKTRRHYCFKWSYSFSWISGNCTLVALLTLDFAFPLGPCMWSSWSWLSGGGGYCDHTGHWWWTLQIVLQDRLADSQNQCQSRSEKHLVIHAVLFSFYNGITKLGLRG